MNDDNNRSWKIIKRVLIILPTCVVTAFLLYATVFNLLVYSIFNSEYDLMFNPIPVYHPEPYPETVAMADFTLRTFNTLNREHENVVISPMLMICDIGITYSMSIEETKNQQEQLLLDSNKYEVDPSYLYKSANSVIDADPPSVHPFDLFSLERIMQLADGVNFRLDDKIHSSSEYYFHVSSLPESTEKGIPSEWENATQHLIPETMIGGTNWCIKNKQESLVNLMSNLYCEVPWRYINFSDKETVFVEPGLAPFTNKESSRMLPTVCSIGRTYSFVNEDRYFKVIKIYLYDSRTLKLWIVMKKDTSADIHDDVSITLDDIKYWLHEETEWKEARHVHFPRFTVSSDIDLKEICQNLGADRAFDPERAEFLDIGGGDSYVDRFESSITISVDENGISKTPSGEPVTQPLTCTDPDIVVDSPFYFMLVNDGTFILFGYVENP